MEVNWGKRTTGIINGKNELIKEQLTNEGELVLDNHKLGDIYYAEISRNGECSYVFERINNEDVNN